MGFQGYKTTNKRQRVGICNRMFTRMKSVVFCLKTAISTIALIEVGKYLVANPSIQIVNVQPDEKPIESFDDCVIFFFLFVFLPTS